ncbi:MAG: hypothetical protein K2N99_02255, partial [Malacoplasma sp.]|nr:hypothetical protein [Malacoplasma sp.]
MNEFYEHIFDVSFNIPDREISFSPYSIVRFIKRCNYFTDTIPSYTLTCKIEDKYLNILRVYDKEISINIKHIMFYGQSRNAMNNRKIIDDLEFACYYDKDTLPNFMNTAKNVDMTNLAVVDTYSQNVLGRESPHEITFQLLLKKDLMMKTYIHNYVLGSEEKPITPITGVMTICEQNPYVNKVLVDPPDNNTAYCDMIIEPAELKDAIKNVQQIYGLYSKSLELFYDNGMLYILNKYNPNHVFTKDELNITTCHIVERSDAVDANDSAYISDDLIGYD